MIEHHLLVDKVFDTPGDMLGLIDPIIAVRNAVTISVREKTYVHVDMFILDRAAEAIADTVKEGAHALRKR